MKITCGLYAAETAFFAIFRIYWGLSKPLIGGAALHNLFEWAIVLHLIAETKNFASFERNMQLATFWILTVISFTIMIPNLLLAFLAEQATGIMLDFGMPLMFLSVYLNKKLPPEVRKFYLLPSIAHTLHILFTIVPLVFANFFVGRVSWYSSFWNEIFIYISAPITHVLYIVWSHTVDEIRLEDHDLTPDETKEDCLLPPKYRFKGAKFYIGIGFLLGLFTLLGVPALLGTCPPTCVTEGPITGTSVAFVNRGYEDRFIEMVRQADLVKTARRAKGNIDYKLVQNDNNPREFRFIETWSSYATLGAWISQGLPKDFFHTPEMVNEVLSGGTLKNFASYKNMGAKCASKAAGGGGKMENKMTSEEL
jgi:quinol monooxygenase YgiN